MKELVKHIEILLLDNDCVVVPQIGGFVTRNAPAKYVEEEGLFLPPIRTVGFNEQLKADDGLLTGSYVTAYRCSEEKARKMLGEQIRDLQQELWENGSYDLGSIGILSLDENNNLEFSPCQAGTVCPAYYGLDALEFLPLECHVAESEEGTTDTTVGKQVVQTEVEPTPPSDSEITIRVKKSWIQNVAAVAAVILLFFLVTPDAQNTAQTEGLKAEFAQLVWMPGVQETSPLPIIKEENPKVCALNTAEKTATGKKTGDKPEEPESGIKEPSGLSGYCVVVASAISEKNAESYVERLHKEGYKEARVYKKGHMVRVVFAGYASKKEAHDKLRVLSDQEEFASAWVYHIK